MKHLTQSIYSLITVSVICISSAHAQNTSNTVKGTDFDQYLVEKNILDHDFKIKNKTALNEILLAMSEEDSRTLPFQVDQNMRLEKMLSDNDKTLLEGTITTPDFEQFEKDVGLNKVNELIKNNSLQQCDILFEHQFQRVNPYHIDLKLSSANHIYQINIRNNECKFE